MKYLIDWGVTKCKACDYSMGVRGEVVKRQGDITRPWAV